MEEAQGNGKQDFNPRSPHGERPTRAHGGWRTSYFNPRSPHGERQSQQPVELRLSYFNPRSPHGERHVLWCRLVIRQDFNPRSPHGERRFDTIQDCIHKVFQSTLPARGATAPLTTLQAFGVISIHAPRTGSDTALVTDKTLTLEFQSTLPARGATGFDKAVIYDYEPFQSTLPARGATLQTAADFQDSRNFNPRSPHGERRGQRRESVPAHQISIHAPRTGSDNTPEERKRVQDAFQSTLPARGAT